LSYCWPSLFFSAVADVPIPYDDCSKNAKITVSSATCAFWPPVLGQPWPFKIAGTLNENVTGGNYAFELDFDGIPIINQKGSLASLNVTFPIKAGPFNINQTLTIPALPVSGKVKITVSATDSSDNDLLCFSVQLNVGLVSHPVNHMEFFREINMKQRSWVAGHNAYFDGWTVAQTRRLMGVKSTKAIHRLPRLVHSASTLRHLPPSFDSRVTFANCTGPVLDQGQCGSCWAFGAAETISDRFCIKIGNFVQLAPLDLVTCDTSDSGCDGGDPGNAFSYAQSSGLVTEDCLPYLTSEKGPIPTCPPDQEPCLNFVSTPPCNTNCSNNASYTGDKHFVSNSYTVSGVDQIAAEIANSGPVEAAFDVYSDFLTYKSGVYSHTSGDLLGGHAVKLIGYGTENGKDYWLAQNSWTTSWGDQGLFKIAKGSDECGMEDDIVTGAV